MGSVHIAKRFTDVWPLTCWTAPAMNNVFQACGGGKMGASLAVIVAHAAPFMGAQTTIMQRYFLPHPLDTIISQPFGMSEDLISMAMAEASSNPILASGSLTLLVCFFNLMQCFVFSKRKDVKAFVSGNVNLCIGLAFAYIVSHHVENKALAMMGLQVFMQILAVPLVARMLNNKDVPSLERPLLLVV